METILYYTVFRLWGKKEEDGKIWISDQTGKGTVDDSEIVAIARIKPKITQISEKSVFIPLATISNLYFR